MRPADPAAAPPAGGTVPHFAAGPATIVFADIVGYTMLMGVDADRTHARWMALLHGQLRPLAYRHGSRLVKSTGDGVAADFPDPAAAFAWASDLQAYMQANDTPDAPPIAFRIAIHHGQVQLTHEDLYGDAVNIAARLQEHAPAGGMVLSEAVRAALPAPLPPLVDLGTLVLRNVNATVRAFALHPPRPVRAPLRAMAWRRPSIAVMPLANLGGDVADLYFVNGIMDDVVVSLGSLVDLAVLARSATLGWQGREADPREVGRMLGVRYLLCGSVRRSRGGQRIGVQLYETEDGDRLWTDHIDARDAELFDVQDAIVARVVGGIAPSIQAAEMRRAGQRHGVAGVLFRRTLQLPPGLCERRLIEVGDDVDGAQGQVVGAQILRATSTWSAASRPRRSSSTRATRWPSRWRATTARSICAIRKARLRSTSARSRSAPATRRRTAGAAPPWPIWVAARRR